ncbi:MAG: WecB/TagA/CpsF family glycosyltransferase [Spirochaetaceae bacterium]
MGAENSQSAGVVKERKRIFLLGVPIDIIPESEIEEAVRDLLDDGGKHHIVFLTLFDFLKARGRGPYAHTVKQASLVIPTSLHILAGARYLGKSEPVRYMPFSFVIKLLGVLEKHGKSLYLVGLKSQPLHRTAANLRDSFPGLKIVGRYIGYFNGSQEQDVITAIKKASPSLVLGGPGIKERQHWFRTHREELPNSLFLWCGECFDIFAGLRKRISDKSWEKGTYWFSDIPRRPWKLLKVFHYLYYRLLLIIAKISSKRRKHHT